MTVDAFTLGKIRRLTNLESNDPVYTDPVITQMVEQYPLIDKNGEPPEIVQSWDASTVPNPDWLPTYDLNRAVADIWEERASSLPDDYNISADGATLNRSQVYEQYMKQVRYFRGKRSAGTWTLRPQPSYKADTPGTTPQTELDA